MAREVRTGRAAPCPSEAVEGDAEPLWRHALGSSEEERNMASCLS